MTRSAATPSPKRQWVLKEPAKSLVTTINKKARAARHGDQGALSSIRNALSNLGKLNLKSKIENYLTADAKKVIKMLETQKRTSN